MTDFNPDGLDPASEKEFEEIKAAYWAAPQGPERSAIFPKYMEVMDKIDQELDIKFNMKQAQLRKKNESDD